MPDLLIRDLSDADLRRLDVRARTLGLSRAEYVRRRLGSDPDARSVTIDDLRRFADAHADLADPSVMARAWR